MEKVSRGSLETGLPSFASVIAVGCFHLGPASEGSGRCCGSGYNGERQPHPAGKAQAGAVDTHAGTLSGPQSPQLWECDLVSLLAGGPGRSDRQDGRAISSWPGFIFYLCNFPSV